MALENVPEKSHCHFSPLQMGHVHVVERHQGTTKTSIEE
jgi:hypothetical protein